MTICVPVKSTYDSASVEVRNIENWASNNRMSLNLSKTWEMLVSGGTLKPLPPATVGIERKKWLKLLGITFQDDPRCWDLHVDNLLSKAGSRIHILRIYRSYGYSRDYLSKLFDSLIISLFLYGIEVWGSALHNKHLERIDKYFKRAHRYGYTLKKFKNLSQRLSTVTNMKPIQLTQRHVDSRDKICPVKNSFNPVFSLAFNFILSFL